MAMATPQNALQHPSQTEVTSRVKSQSYRALFRHWALMTLGRSYWHLSQGLGSQFAPGMLEGYFNDLRAKTAWRGSTDDEGLPVSKINGALRHFPTTILQKGLGHWDRWLESGRRDANEYGQFARVVRWALMTQDQRGGWPLPVLEPAAVSPYSAMVQGQGI